MTTKILIRKIIHWFLAIISVLMILSGFGITHYQIVSKLTLGLMSKSLAFQMHSVLTWPFIIALALHIYITRRRR